MPKRRINYRQWAIRVITWDTALPAVIAIVPIIVGFFFPNRRGFIEIIAVILPIVAFLLRFISGKRHIDSNGCSDFIRNIQLLVFCLGILPLVLFDCFFILFEVMPNGGALSLGDLIIFGIIFIYYLTMMTIAMYPGRTVSSDSEPEDLLAYHDTWGDDA
jgi:hypothetical protein